MAKTIALYSKANEESLVSQSFKAILEDRKTRVKRPLTPQKLRERKGLETLSDEDAANIIQTIKNLAALFFEITCLKQHTCIDNQQVVSLNQEKKAA